MHTGRDGLWLAVDAKEIQGFIAIDGSQAWLSQLTVVHQAAAGVPW